MKYSFGTDEYITQVVNTHSRRLLSVAYAILKSQSDAEDAVQEAFLRLIIKQPHFKDAEHEKAWLLRVVINTSRNMLKSTARNNLPIEEEIPYTQHDPTLLLCAVLSLPLKYRTVTHLYYYEGYSIKEIASILSIPSATVGTRLARSRAILKNKLEREDYEWL